MKTTLVLLAVVVIVLSVLSSVQSDNIKRAFRRAPSALYRDDYGAAVEPVARRKRDATQTTSYGAPPADSYGAFRRDSYGAVEVKKKRPPQKRAAIRTPSYGAPQKRAAIRTPSYGAEY